MTNNCALSIDMEDWFHGIISLNNSLLSQKELESRFILSTNNFLEILSKCGGKATFFVLASIAKKCPSLIKDIHSLGHEIASHGYSHQLVYKMKPDDFRDDIYIAKSILENIIQEDVNGYRAPYFSITERSKWAIPLIEEVGYTYDSSIFPFKNFMYGIKGVPNSHYYHSANLLEIPPYCLEILNLKIPWVGGLYFRLLPYSIFKIGFSKIINRNKKGIIYLHTADFDLNQPNNFNSSKFEKFIHFAGIKGLNRKVESLLKDFRPNSIKNIYSDMLCKKKSL